MRSVASFVSLLETREDYRARGLDSGPKVSIIMPSFNQVQFIERSLLSVLNQNYANIELIVVDGGSTDGTVEVIKKYASHIHYWISESDKGQSDALNKGFGKATGEVVGWLNSDDLYLPGAIASAVEEFEANREVTVVFGDWWTIDSEDNVIEELPAFDFNLEHFVYEGFTHNSQGMFWKRSAHERFGQFDVELHRTMDYDLIVRLGVSEGERKFHRVSAPFACFRRYEGQKTSGQDSVVNREHRRIAKRSGFSDKFLPSGRRKRLIYRVRRAYWYAKRCGLGYALEKAQGSFRQPASRETK